MTETLAVFRSRSQAMDCVSRLKALGVRAELINTPVEAGVGCGLSVKFASNIAPRAKTLISRAGYSSFYGYMTLFTRGENVIVRRF